MFLSMRVNGAVFYHLKLINLLLPSQKNLEIGLGLVNTLNLSEMTAVLANEFGHFAQRSMAVGRWVYIAQQVAGQIVAQRALGREMEFQADLVSVSLTGSDALVHALHRLGAADGTPSAWRPASWARSTRCRTCVNGLGTPVELEIGEKKLSLALFEHRSLELQKGRL